MLDSAFNLIITDSDELGNQKLTDLKLNTILKQNKGDITQRFTADLGNITAFTNHQQKLESDARILGSASEGALGVNPVSGTPFALQNLIVQQGQGIHEYRQGKIATFVADVLYRDWILGYLVKEMNGGKTFSEELSLDEMQEVADKISKNKTEERIKEMILNGQIVTPEMRDGMIKMFKDSFTQNGTRGFFEVLEGELKEIPVEVFVNIKQKQKDMAKQADAITNILREVLKNPQAFQQIPGVGKVFNELLENSGLSPIDYTQIVTPPLSTPVPVQQDKVLAK